MFIRLSLDRFEACSQRRARWVAPLVAAAGLCAGLGAGPPSWFAPAVYAQPSLPDPAPAGAPALAPNEPAPDEPPPGEAVDAALVLGDVIRAYRERPFAEEVTVTFDGAGQTASSTLRWRGERAQIELDLGDYRLWHDRAALRVSRADNAEEYAQESDHPSADIALQQAFPRVPIPQLWIAFGALGDGVDPDDVGARAAALVAQGWTLAALHKDGFDGSWAELTGKLDIGTVKVVASAPRWNVRSAEVRAPGRASIIRIDARPLLPEESPPRSIGFDPSTRRAVDGFLQLRARRPSIRVGEPWPPIVLPNADLTGVAPELEGPGAIVIFGSTAYGHDALAAAASAGAGIPGFRVWAVSRVSSLEQAPRGRLAGTALELGVDPLYYLMEDSGEIERFEVHADAPIGAGVIVVLDGQARVVAIVGLGPDPGMLPDGSGAPAPAPAAVERWTAAVRAALARP